MSDLFNFMEGKLPENRRRVMIRVTFSNSVAIFARIINGNKYRTFCQEFGVYCLRCLGVF
jgi:hypothetical protein